MKEPEEESWWSSYCVHLLHAYLKYSQEGVYYSLHRRYSFHFRSSHHTCIDYMYRKIHSYLNTSMSN